MDIDTIGWGVWAGPVATLYIYLYININLYKKKIQFLCRTMKTRQSGEERRSGTDEDETTLVYFSIVLLFFPSSPRPVLQSPVAPSVSSSPSLPRETPTAHPPSLPPSLARPSPPRACADNQYDISDISVTCSKYPVSAVHEKSWDDSAWILNETQLRCVEHAFVRSYLEPNTHTPE